MSLTPRKSPRLKFQIGREARAGAGARGAASQPYSCDYGSHGRLCPFLLFFSILGTIPTLFFFLIEILGTLYRPLIGEPTYQSQENGWIRLDPGR